MMMMMMNPCFLPSSAIVEVATTLTQRHLSILAYGPKYVPQCQSYFSRTSVQIIIMREFDRISSAIMNGLTMNCVTISEDRAKLFFGSLKHLINQFYEEKLSWKLFRSVRREQSVVRSIQRQLNVSTNQTVLRRTDKSKVFHLGSSHDYEEKAMMYMMKTRAYEEVEDGRCPLQENLTCVIDVLDRLLKAKAIDKRQWSRMAPDKNRIELGHLYFLPKPHKVGLRPFRH